MFLKDGVADGPILCVKYGADCTEQLVFGEVEVKIYEKCYNMMDVCI
jgi:hypothetical protein